VAEHPDLNKLYYGDNLEVMQKSLGTGPVVLRTRD
jgi:hypothetical protein